MATAESRKHFLLMSFPGYGHMIPLLELGKKIALHHQVTFAVSECMLSKIRAHELVSGEEVPLIGIRDGFVEKEFDPKNTGDPEAADTMFETIMPGARKFLETMPSTVGGEGDAGHPITTPVDVVIGDNMLAEQLTACHERGIPYHFFNTAALSMALVALFIDENYPTLPPGQGNELGFFEIPSPGAPPRPIAVMTKRLMLPINQTTHLVSGIVVNSVRDFEEDILQAIMKFPVMKGIPIRFVGPLVPEREKISSAKLEQQKKVKAWMDGRGDMSVVYVGFGSIAIPPPEQIVELAEGLLKLDKPFIWSLPATQYQHLPQTITSKIADQLDSVDSQFLILPWAPQKLVLQHPATSTFVSHCGWNSTLEGLSSGVPVVAWPMFADQMLNAEFLSGKCSTGVLVKGTGLLPKRTVPAEEVTQTIRQVGWAVDGSTESTYRKAAHLWKDKITVATHPGGSTDRDFHELMQFEVRK